MRTVDPLHRSGVARDEEGGTPFFRERGGHALRELELAARERRDGAQRATCLAFVEARNKVTGEWGIIVHRQLEARKFSRPLAELLAPSGELTEESTNSTGSAMKRLRARFESAYAERRERKPRPAAFAGVRNSSGYSLLTRLLLTPFEINQWTGSGLEPHAGFAN